MKKITALVITTIIANSALAVCENCAEHKPGLEARLHGFFDFQAGIRNQNKLNKNKDLTGSQKKGALYSEAHIRAQVSNTTENDLTYGAAIVLTTTAKNAAGSGDNGSHIFMESEYGKIELGSRADASTLMRVSAYDVAKGSGDGWLKFVNLNPDELYMGTPTDYGMIIDGFQAKKGTERSRKVTYYTPNLYGLQLGISYIPDTSNAGDKGINEGSGSMKNSVRDFQDGFQEYHQKIMAKDVIGAGISYERNISDGIDLKVAITGEHGKVRRVQFDNVETPGVASTEKLSHLKAYNIGAVLNLGNFAFGASYVNLGTSLTSPRLFPIGANRTTKIYTAGVGYTQGPIGVSLTYLHTNKYQNKLNSYTLGSDFKMLPGLAPYAEVTVFNAKNKGYKFDSKSSYQTINQSRKGTVYMLGAKLSF